MLKITLTAIALATVAASAHAETWYAYLNNPNPSIDEYCVFNGVAVLFDGRPNPSALAQTACASTLVRVAMQANFDLGRQLTTAEMNDEAIRAHEATNMGAGCGIITPELPPSKPVENCLLQNLKHIGEDFRRVLARRTSDK
jgi:hypothetical protein